MRETLLGDIFWRYCCIDYRRFHWLDWEAMKAICNLQGRSLR